MEMATVFMQQKAHNGSKYQYFSKTTQHKEVIPGIKQ